MPQHTKNSNPKPLNYSMNQAAAGPSQKQARQAGKRQERKQAWKAGRSERQAKKAVHVARKLDLSREFYKLTAPRKAGLGLSTPKPSPTRHKKELD